MYSRVIITATCTSRNDIYPFASPSDCLFRASKLRYCPTKFYCFISFIHPRIKRSYSIHIPDTAKLHVPVAADHSGHLSTAFFVPGKIGNESAESEEAGIHGRAVQRDQLLRGARSVSSVWRFIFNPAAIRGRRSRLIGLTGVLTSRSAIFVPSPDLRNRENYSRVLDLFFVLFFLRGTSIQ